MTKKLLLVDYENIQKIDLSLLDESYRAIIFVGAQQNPPKASRNPATAHRFQRVEFFKIAGSGKNALDFHIAFHLGRTIETAPKTECFVLSGDKGFDPLLLHINTSGLMYKRIESIEELVYETAGPAATALVQCQRCHKASTIEHHGGQWCTNCGCFASRPEPVLLPSNQPDSYPTHRVQSSTPERDHEVISCGWCNRPKDMSGAIYDDGEWMCADCISHHARPL